MKLELKGRIPSKKNSKRVFKRAGRTMVLSSKSWMKFETDAIAQIEEQLEGMKIKSLKPPYEVNYVFRMKGKGATDIDNMMAGVNDILEKVGILEDDKHILKVSAEKLIGEPEYLAEVGVLSI